MLKAPVAEPTARKTSSFDGLVRLIVTTSCTGKRRNANRSSICFY